jgi:hypothetical protein
VARYAAALRAAATSAGLVRFAITGLVLTPVSVMARAIPADAAADDLAALFDAALRAEGCYEAGSTPMLWYVNLVYFTGPVHDADELVTWTEARQQIKVIDVLVTELQIAAWRHTVVGMMPVVLASASCAGDPVHDLLRPSADANYATLLRVPSRRALRMRVPLPDAIHPRLATLCT